MDKSRRLLLLGGMVLVAFLVVSASWMVMAQPPGNPGLGLPPDEQAELQWQAKRLGMKVQDVLARREKREHELRLAQAKQPPQLLVHGQWLYVLDHGWLLQFDAESLEMKHICNLDMLKQQHMRELELKERQEQQRQRRNR